MTVQIAGILVAVAYGYGLAGLLVGVAFLVTGLDRVEPGARGAHGFRPLMLPGLALLWPWVLWRWVVLARHAG